MKNFIDTISKMKEDFDPTKIVLLTSSEDLMEDLSKKLNDTPVIISTHDPPLSSLLQRSNVKVRKMHHSPGIGLNVLNEAKDVVLTLVNEGILDETDKVLFVISTDIDTILSFDISEIGVVNLKANVEGRVDLMALEAAFNVGTTIIREGKEGLPAGALFILGDTNNVLKHTRESIRNPLQGFSKEELNIKNKENWNTIKEFSMLDGAFIIDENGYPVAAGRYVMFTSDMDGDVDEGLGGRHLAAASITYVTKAIAIVVSSEGAIRIYKDGRTIYSIKSL